MRTKHGEMFLACVMASGVIVCSWWNKEQAMILSLSMGIHFITVEWRKKIHVTDPKIW